MRIGELARRAGVRASALRFYEARGLLPAAARNANGYRDYDEFAVETVKFIDRGRHLGFTLAEIGAHLRSPRDEKRKARLKRGLEAKLAALDAHLAEVRVRRDLLAALIAEVDAQTS